MDINKTPAIYEGLVWFVLFNDTCSQLVRIFSVMYDHTFSKLANHWIRHQATHKVGCQHGDCLLVYVSTYGLTYSLYQPRGEIYDMI